MKLSIITSALSMAASVAAGSFFQQQSLGIEFDIGASGIEKVPGENPLYYCGDTSRDIASIETVDLSPNPPLPGQTLNISAVAILKDDIEKGAKADVIAKYGLITMYKTSADICDNVNQIDLECPVNRGKLFITKSVDIPSQVPPGTYSVMANAYTEDGRPIVCLKAILHFYQRSAH